MCHRCPGFACVPKKNYFQHRSLSATTAEVVESRQAGKRTEFQKAKRHKTGGVSILLSGKHKLGSSF